MALPYRTRRRIRRLSKFLILILLAGSLAAGGWILWAGRFVVYSRDGAKLDFTRSSESITGVLATPPEPGTPVAIYYNEGDNAVAISGELTRFSGYYLTREHLKGNIEELRTQLLSLPDTVPIMIEVKDIYGEFFYNTGMAGAQKHSSANAVTTLIGDLVKSHRYVIAMVAAFRDYEWGLHNTNNGIPHSSGGYLWMDDDGCYWIDPNRNATLSYLVGIIEELKAMGVSEVVLRDFRIPTEGNILYEEDAGEVIAAARDYVVGTCANADSFAVSFLNPGFDVPQGARCRVYLENVSALQIKKTVENITVDVPETQIVFMTSISDTRFDAYCVVRPVDMLH